MAIIIIFESEEPLPKKVTEGPEWLL